MGEVNAAGVDPAVLVVTGLVQMQHGEAAAPPATAGNRRDVGPQILAAAGTGHASAQEEEGRSMAKIVGSVLSERSSAMATVGLEMGVATWPESPHPDPGLRSQRSQKR